MADNQDTNERTEQPTERRLRQSREKGQIARSRELNTMLSLLVAAAGLITLGGGISIGFMDLLESTLTFGRQAAFDKSAITTQFSQMAVSSLLIFAPFLGVMILGALLGPLCMGGWSFSFQAMAFKAEKLNPLTGLKRIFSAKGLLELLKALFKFVLVIVATLILFDLYLDTILQLGINSPYKAAAYALELLLWGLVALSAALSFIVVFDVPFELWNHKRQLKMTRQEVRDEMKETDGRPEVKSRIRALQREISQRRMMEAVPTAHVVVTNPTHYAVALKYDETPGSAPKVVAKGRDLVALRIRSVAIENNVAIYAAPPLARALHASAKIGEEIPQNLYMAVAKVLAYVYQLRQSNTYTAPPGDLQIPEEYRDLMDDAGEPANG